MADAPEPAPAMISASNPWAVQAGNGVLAAGGTALDAAVAVQMVLGFVEAPETGLGGGGFLLYHDAASGTLHTYDGRETASAAADPYQFTLFSLPLPRALALTFGQSVGVPGLVAMLGLAHAEHGTLPWADLLTPAIDLAETGVPVPDQLRHSLQRDPSLWLFQDMRRYFIGADRANPPVLQNTELANTLRRLADEGPDAFYHGDIPAAIIARAQRRRLGASTLTQSDFTAYEALPREPLCAPYREWTLCGPPPPTSGGLAVLQIMGILAFFDLHEMAPGSPEAVHLIAEASRLALADRFHYVGDPAVVNVPTEALLDPAYVARRADRIDPSSAATDVLPGRIYDNGRPAVPPPRVAPSAPVTEGTSHFTVVDAQGNMAVLTSSIEAPFGSRMMAEGFLLNNQLTDFTFQPNYQGGLHPNAVEPGKRPRSSMAPIVVYNQQNEPVLALGSRGGSRIIGYVVQMLVETLDWNQPIYSAVNSPRFLHSGEALELEADTPLVEHQAALSALGHTVSVRSLISGVHGVQRTPDGWVGGADPRLDGSASGVYLTPNGLPINGSSDE
ncbi:MAG: gamma-glutamyltransferase [Natronospirillum sp.]